MGYSNFVSSFSRKADSPEKHTAETLDNSSDAVAKPRKDFAPTMVQKEGNSPNSATPARALSLDAFRGLTIAVMLLVNNAALDAALPHHMTHAAFGEAPTLTDMVFPWFLLAVGIAIPFSVASLKKKGATNAQQFRQTIRRVVLLYAIGILVDSSVRQEWYFGTGVLQLIALVSGAARLLYTPNRLVRLGIIVALLGGYGFALGSLPFAGFLPGEFTETHNLSHHLNERYLHAWTLDGLLHVLPTTALALIGTLVGDDLRSRSRPTAQRDRILVAAAILTAIGLLWNQFMPMSKQFWTPPYICLTGGLGLFLLAFFHQWGDIWGLKFPVLRASLTPLIVFGMNPLVAYAGAILVKSLIFQRVTTTMDGKIFTWQEAILQYFATTEGRFGGGWLYMGLYLLAVWIFCAYLYRRRIFLRV